MRCPTCLKEAREVRGERTCLDPSCEGAVLDLLPPPPPLTFKVLQEAMGRVLPRPSCSRCGDAITIGRNLQTKDGNYCPACSPAVMEEIEAKSMAAARQQAEFRGVQQLGGYKVSVEKHGITMLKPSRDKVAMARNALFGERRCPKCKITIMRGGKEEGALCIYCDPPKPEPQPQPFSGTGIGHMLAEEEKKKGLFETAMEIYWRLPQITDDMRYSHSTLELGLLPPGEVGKDISTAGMEKVTIPAGHYTLERFVAMVSKQIWPEREPKPEKPKEPPLSGADLFADEVAKALGEHLRPNIVVEAALDHAGWDVFIGDMVFFFYDGYNAFRPESSERKEGIRKAYEKREVAKISKSQQLGAVRATLAGMVREALGEEFLKPLSLEFLQKFFGGENPGMVDLTLQQQEWWVRRLRNYITEALSGSID